MAKIFKFLIVILAAFYLTNSEPVTGQIFKAMKQKAAFKLLEEFQDYLQLKIEKESTPNSVKVLNFLAGRLDKTTLQACEKCFDKDVSQFLFCAGMNWRKRFQHLEANKCY